MALYDDPNGTDVGVDDVIALDYPKAKQQRMAQVLRGQPPIGMPTAGPEMPAPDAAAAPMSRTERIMQQIADLQAKGPDAAQYEQLAKERAEGAQRDFLAGLALQSMGGKALAPAGGMVLRQALAAQEPEKVGGGILSGGRFIADPYAQRESNLRSLEMQLRVATQAEAQAATIQEKQRAQAAQLGLQKQIADEANATRRETAQVMAGARGEAQQQRQDQQAFQRAVALRNDFDPLVKNERVAIATYPQIEAALSGPQNPQSDMRAVFRYMKMLDPTSVVREGEYATAKNAAGVDEKVRNLWNSMLKGNILTPEQRTRMLEQARSERDTAQTNFNTQARRYHEIARRSGVDPRDVTPGYDFGGEPGGAPSAGGLPTGVTVTRVK